MGSISRGSNAAGSQRRAQQLIVGSLAAVALLAGQSKLAPSAELAVPPAIQAALTVKILEYDRSLKSWAGSGLTVGIITRAGGPSAAEFSQALAGRDAQGVPFKSVEHAYRDVDSLVRWIEGNGVKLAYLSPELSAEGTTAILSALAARKLPSLTVTRSQFQSGAALGIVAKEGKPHILVGLAAAKAAGMDLDPKLLQLAEVVR